MLIDYFLKERIGLWPGLGFEPGMSGRNNEKLSTSLTEEDDLDGFKEDSHFEEDRDILQLFFIDHLADFFGIIQKHFYRLFAIRMNNHSFE